jgi:hypothetical protein
MLKKPGKFLIVSLLIVLHITVLFGESSALDPSVITLVVNPKKTEVYAGSGKIVITVDAPGKNLAFTWKLNGPGELEGKGSAVFYKVPEKVEKPTQTIITLRVKDQSEQEVTKILTFTILPTPEPTPRPGPAAETTPAEKKGTSKTTMIVLGAGAVAALGSGIAILAGGSENGSDNRYTTPGVNVGGYLWYLAKSPDSCETVCASHGGYHEATRTYAGSDGTNENCAAVLTALGAPHDADGVILAIDFGGLGCHYAADVNRYQWVRSTATTTASAGGWPGRGRACACNQ